MIPASPSNNYHYNPTLKLKAQELRTNATKAEACLWKHVLKGQKLKSYTFKRQRPVLNYIADFMCEDLLLVIEVDGSSHDIPEVFENDLIRTKAIEEVGFTILRFRNETVLKDLENVRLQLIHWIETQELLDK